MANITEHERAKLYEVQHNGKTHYGTRLATNSRGEYVMELKGSSEVIAVAPEACSEVVPYTVGLRPYSYLVKRQVGKGNMIHYRCKEGAVKEGDIIVLRSGGVYQVEAVDTKSKRAAYLNGVRVEGEIINSSTEEEDDDEDLD